jgi:uncharacterized protein YdhG (YjbR/CyaY superfamily)
MQSTAVSPEEYQASLPEDRKAPVEKLRKVIKKNLPKGFKEVMSYGMLGYVVPHSIYPPGYHCDPKLPLPYINLASQKNFIALYNMGIYSSPKLLEWFTTEYAKLGIGKLDMGKSCIRFKNMEKIPYDLIGELCTKMTVEEWIACYEKILQR